MTWKSSGAYSLPREGDEHHSAEGSHWVLNTAAEDSLLTMSTESN